MFRRLLPAMWVSTLVLGSATIVQCQGLGSEHDRLIERLVQKGDALREADKQEAGVTYSMANFFAGDKALSEKIQAKWRALDVPSMRLSAAQSKRLSEIVHTMDLDACASDWPSRTPETDLVNLRMLLNDKLFAHVREARSISRAAVASSSSLRQRYQGPKCAPPSENQVRSARKKTVPRR